ncbi:hypothetical protein [Agrococcus sp. HG114]|uniref:hypothetical protein n=1 Tax=Agrococcus sp. HG114 TaxID=2969757 RepID=UPI00215B0CEE|nr:hypothetical protein [Agrococcus sp. HG114]MCR8671558.1 hypothetical protein [Agrococcus sp. HG114]
MPILVLVPMVLGAAIGLFVRFSMPGREWVGLYLNPGAAAAAAGVAWTIGVLLGATADSLWLWLASLAAAAVVAVALPKLLPPRRERADRELLAELTAKRA